MSQYITPGKKETQASVQTPVGELEWVVISGEGKLNDLKGVHEYVATVVLEEDTAKAFCSEIDAWYKENKPKGTKVKSMGYYPHKIKTDEVDEDGLPVYEETGKVAISFKTQTTYQDEKQKVIKVFNKNGSEVALGDKLIGNGSRGRLKGMCNIYHNKPTKETGVSNYLAAVQLTKFVEYVGGPQFDEVDDEDGDFEGFETELTPVSDSSSEGTPRL